MAGLFSQRGESHFWLHPELANPSSARRHFQQAAWPNPGGGRVWLAPEIDLFFPNYPDLKVYLPPPAVDPGRYQFQKTSHGAGLVTEGQVRLGRTGRQLKFRISQRFFMAANPLAGAIGLDYAGFTQRTHLEILGGCERIRDRIGLWHLLQLPLGGKVWITCRRRVQPTILFCRPSPLPPRVFQHLPRLLAHRTVSRREYKFGLPPGSLGGRIGYLGRQGKAWSLVVRDFSVDPRAFYVDVPWHHPSGTGTAVQFCVVDNPTLGKFAEIEHHGPAVGWGTGRNQTEEACDTWSYRGNQRCVLRAAQALLS